MCKNMEVKGTKPSEMVSSDDTASFRHASHMLIIQHLPHHFITFGFRARSNYKNLSYL